MMNIYSKSAKILVSQAYRPAIAEKFYDERKYSRVVEICREELKENPQLLSLRILYAKALYATGQFESSQENFLKVLSSDPENIVALKFIADIKFGEKKEAEAMAHYWKILELDPDCRGLKSDLSENRSEAKHRVTIIKKAEGDFKSKPAKPLPIEKIKFYTETMGDLYSAQGYLGLAAEVYRNLRKNSSSPRLDEKISRIEKILEKGDS